MKTCPHCGGQLRPSVIKCVHCGSRLDEPQPATVPSGGPAQAPSPTASAPDGASGVPGGGTSAPPQAAARPVSDRAPTPPPSVFDPPKPASPDPWVTPAARTEPRIPIGTTLPPAVAPSLRAKPPRRADLPLLAAGIVAVIAAVVAATSLSLPWVTGTLTVTGPREREVAELPFFADDAIARNLVLGVAVVIGVLGLLWFWYGLDRGVQLPTLANPGLALLAGVVGWGTVALTKLGGFVWEAGFVAHAREAGLTREAMRELLADRASRTMAFAAEAGATRFAIAASLALAAGAVAWWSQRDRAV